MIFKGDFNDDFWDEHQWEAHLNDIKRKNIHLRELFSSDHSTDTPRWRIHLNENTDELDAVDAFIEEELQIDEVYFPGEDEGDDFDNDEDWDDDMGDFYDFEDDDLFGEEDFDDGEEWKELSEDFAMSENGSIEMLDIYNDSRTLAVHILQWAETINPNKLTAECNNFIGNVLKIGAKIAGGYSFGFERDFIGGNIAYTKKALHSANDGLTILKRDLKKTRFLSRKQYYYFHEQLFTLRNNIGIYIQELRDRFYNSL